MTKIVKIADGLQIGKFSVSHDELELIEDRATAVHYGGCPDELLDEFEAEQPGTVDYACFHDWLLQRAEPEWNVIHTYSRGQAIADGQLVDVSAQAGETGFTMPVAITRAVYETCVRVPPKVVCQDERGRLHDVLFCLFVAIKREGMDSDTVFFKLHVRNDNRRGTPPMVQLRAVCGPGDDPAPVITILTMDED